MLNNEIRNKRISGLAGEYKWRLKLNPNEDDNVGKDKSYIAVYLAMANTNSLHAIWEINIEFTILLMHQISGNYISTLGIFYYIDKSFTKFFSRKDLLDPSKGFLINDNCVFGAEVYVLKREAVTECLSLKNVDIPDKRDWNIPSFSKLRVVWNSEVFLAGGQKWMFSLFPEGCGKGTGCGVFIYLHYVGSESNLKHDVWCRLHFFLAETIWFSPSIKNWGWAPFIDIATIEDPNQGFIVKDCCLLHIEISVQAVAKISPLH
ncbi:hypothetical protein MIMGU_mgv1a018490mg [Erythranthe guttata]|uniref:MATH domain-containing protein n=1 Tax=Erythranthe guttata TaxID=4155 RepID=A0A022RYU3_ERYGU|nr:hypothetical protein MIMGU_mgv1a018490mg [Erythranthe guttata]